MLDESEVVGMGLGKLVGSPNGSSNLYKKLDETHQISLEVVRPFTLTSVYSAQLMPTEAIPSFSRALRQT